MIGDLRSSVLEEVDARAEAMGLERLPTTEVLLRSVSRANAVLGRFATAYRDQVSRVDRCQSDIDALVAFHESGPFGSVNDVIDGVGDSASFGTEAATACVILSSADESSEPVIRLDPSAEAEPSSSPRGCRPTSRATCSLDTVSNGWGDQCTSA